MKKVYVVGDAVNYANFITGVKLVDNIEEANIVLFTGGEDVDPSLYCCEKHYTTYSNIERDNYEKAIFDKIKPNQLALGICRGSQFLCVMNGGKLIQNVECHGIFGTHCIKNRDGVGYEITSTHHQMQYPFDLDEKDYSILYWTDRRSDIYQGDGIDEDFMYDEVEPEIVYYHKKDKPQCLAIQGHPEYMRKEAPVVQMINRLINAILRTL